MDHAGKENGFLIFTYDDGVRAGIPRASFNSTIGWLIEVGLVEKTHNGGYAGGALRDPSRYRLTYLPQKHEEAIGGPTYLFPIHNWVDIELEVLDGKRFLREKKHKAPSRKTRRLKHDTNQIIKSDTDAAARASSAATKALATERHQI